MKQEVKESEVRVKHKTGALGEKEDFSSWETFLARRLRETSCWEVTVPRGSPSMYRLWREFGDDRQIPYPLVLAFLCD
jgi:hypothetical protein